MFFDSTSTNETKNLSQNAGFSEIGGGATSLNIEGSTGKSSTQNTSISLTDGGAITGALGLAGSVSKDAFRQVELAGKSTADTVAKAVAAVSESARGESENVMVNAMKWGTIIAVALGAFWFLSKMKG